MNKRKWGFWANSILIGLLLVQCVTNGEKKLAQPLSIVKHPWWSIPATIYEVNIRQYTPEGTFNAFRTHLPRLKKLGVDILWLMPVQPIGRVGRKGRLGSYYAIRNYRAVNPEFGTAQDLKALIEEAHQLGMYVILDWVANHTALDHPWVREQPHFYQKDAGGHFRPPLEDWSDVYALDYTQKALRDSMAHTMAWWIREFNLDGFRCDVAEMVPLDFWDALRPFLESIKPVFMLAEGENALLHQRAFDMTYSWRMYKAFNGIARGIVAPRLIDTLLTREEALYPAGAMRMRFLTNHDENSWHGTIEKRLGEAHKPLAVLMFTLPGKPLLYSGQEIGLNKTLRFFNKDTIVWKASPLTAFYQTLMHAYHDYPALHKGAYRRFPSPGEICFFERHTSNQRIYVVVNLAENTAHLNIPASLRVKQQLEIFSKKVSVLPETITLAPREYRVWLEQP
ncbi:MAG: alpha-amylase [Calditrichaeota bacterium]|nr:MAG: alpha-amylase [Calditrichota bacterium]